MNKECIIQSEWRPSHLHLVFLSSSHVQKLEQSKLHKETINPSCSLSYLPLPPQTLAAHVLITAVAQLFAPRLDSSSLGFPNVLKGPGPTALIYVCSFTLTKLWHFISYKVKVCKVWLWPKWPRVNHGEISGLRFLTCQMRTLRFGGKSQHASPLMRFQHGAGPLPFVYPPCD